MSVKPPNVLPRASAGQTLAQVLVERKKTVRDFQPTTELVKQVRDEMLEITSEGQFVLDNRDDKNLRAKLGQMPFPMRRASALELRKFARRLGRNHPAGAVMESVASSVLEPVGPVARREMDEGEFALPRPDATPTTDKNFVQPSGSSDPQQAKTEPGWFARLLSQLL